MIIDNDYAVSGCLILTNGLTRNKKVMNLAFIAQCHSKIKSSMKILSNLENLELIRVVA